MANNENTATRAAKQVIRTLQSKGFEAFLVGGCVRDLLCGRDPKDCDVTSNATPEDVQVIFPKTIPVGAQFGVVVVVQDEIQVEVATYRADGTYSDGRRPDSVTYSTNVREDIVRRDFTMNGLLLTPPMDFTVEGVKVGEWELFDGDAIIDFVGGREDIENRIVRAIGDPNKRFEEDALRMLRAVRFAAQLGFEIEEKTLEAIERNAPLLKNISRERIAMELFKILSSPEPLKGILPMFTSGLSKYALPEKFAKVSRFAHTITRFGMFQAEKDPLLGLAMFLADCAGEFTLEVCNFLKLSGLDREKLANVPAIFIPTFHDSLVGQNVPLARMKRLCRRPGLELALEILTQDELIGKTNYGVEAVMQLMLTYKAFQPEEINPTPMVTGKDLIELGMTPGPIFTEILFDVETAQLNGTMGRTAMLTSLRERLYQDVETKEPVYTGLNTETGPGRAG